MKLKQFLVDDIDIGKVALYVRKYIPTTRFISENVKFLEKHGREIFFEKDVIDDITCR